MRKLPFLMAVVALVSIAALACAGEAETPAPQIIEVEKIVTVEVITEREVVREVPVEREVVREVEVERIVEVEKVVTVEVVQEVEVVMEKIVTVEVEKVVEVEKILIATPTPPPAGEPRFGGTLRITSQGSISQLDPVYTAFYVTNAVSSHIFETLFGWNTNLEAQPRMVKSWDVSSDGLVYNFTLRDGQTFHNGRTVQSVDIIASVNRWRDAGSPGAGVIRKFSEDDWLTAVDDSTMRATLTEPLGALVFILGLPHFGSFMMPESQASTSFSEPVPELIGSGAYKFSLWEPGNQVALDRFADYVPRNEPGNGYVGASIAYFDRLIWLEIPDEETKVAGLQTAEWDVVDSAAFDFLKRLQDDPELQVGLYKPGMRSNIYLNPQIPPFSYLEARQALQTGISVEDFMYALGDSDVWIVCAALYYCGTPLAVDDGERFDVETSAGTRTIGYNIQDMETAQLLLNDSDYAGETTVILNPTDYGTITPLGLVLQPVMREIGFIVEMPAYDWATVTSMFGNTDSYGLATDWYSHWCCGTPVQDHLISGTLDFIIKDEELLNLQLSFVREPDAAARLDIVREINRQRFQKVTSLSLGQFFPITPATIDLKNFNISALPFYTNTWFERD